MMATRLNLNNGGLVVDADQPTTEITSTTGTITILPSVSTADVYVTGETASLKTVIDKTSGFADTAGSIKDYVDASDGTLQSVPVSSDTPSANQVLQFDGTEWKPAHLSKSYADVFSTSSISPPTTVSIVTLSSSDTLETQLQDFSISNNQQHYQVAYTGSSAKTFKIDAMFNTDTITGSGSVYLYVNGQFKRELSAYGSQGTRRMCAIMTLNSNDTVSIRSQRDTSSTWSMQNTQLIITEV